MFVGLQYTQLFLRLHDLTAVYMYIRNPKIRLTLFVCVGSQPFITSMPRRKVSLDLKSRVPVLRYGQHFMVKEICQILGIKKTLVYQTLQYYNRYGACFNVKSQ